MPLNLPSINTVQVAGAGQNMYGLDTPGNVYKSKYQKLLRTWHRLCQRYDIPYAIIFGTLLGFFRNHDFIPYDHDIDVTVDRQGVDKLLGLMGQDLSDVGIQHSVWDDQLIHLDFQADTFALICNNTHLQPPNPLPRKWVYRECYNCQGEAVQHGKAAEPCDHCRDPCSLDWISYRLILKTEGCYLWIDVFPYSGLDASSGDITTFRSQDAKPFEFEVLSGNLGGVTVNYPEPTWTRRFLTGYYGKDYLTPDHVYVNGQWVNRNPDKPVEVPLPEKCQQVFSGYPSQDKLSSGRLAAFCVVDRDQLATALVTLLSIRRYNPNYDLYLFGPDPPDSDLAETLQQYRIVFVTLDYSDIFPGRSLEFWQPLVPNMLYGMGYQFSLAVAPGIWCCRSLNPNFLTRMVQYQYLMAGTCFRQTLRASLFTDQWPPEFAKYIQHTYQLRPSGTHLLRNLDPELVWYNNGDMSRSQWGEIWVETFQRLAAEWEKTGGQAGRWPLHVTELMALLLRDSTKLIQLDPSYNFQFATKYDQDYYDLHHDDFAHLVRCVNLTQSLPESANRTTQGYQSHHSKPSKQLQQLQQGYLAEWKDFAKEQFG